LNTLSFVLPLSVVSLTVVPAGEVREMSRSAHSVCVISRNTVTFEMYVSALAKQSGRSTLPLSGIASDGASLTLAVASVGAPDSVVTSSDHALNVPESVARSSTIVSVHVPFGSSPRKASKGPSGESGVSGTLFA
jgi:hypothetical protein